MPIRFKHDAPGLVGAFAEGQAKRRSQLSKYGFDMVAQQQKYRQDDLARQQDYAHENNKQLGNNLFQLYRDDLEGQRTAASDKTRHEYDMERQRAGFDNDMQRTDAQRKWELQRQYEQREWELANEALENGEFDEPFATKIRDNLGREAAVLSNTQMDVEQKRFALDRIRAEREGLMGHRRARPPKSDPNAAKGSGGPGPSANPEPPSFEDHYRQNPGEVNKQFQAEMERRRKEQQQARDLGQTPPYADDKAMRAAALAAVRGDYEDVRNGILPPPPDADVVGAGIAAGAAGAVAAGGGFGAALVPGVIPGQAAPPATGAGNPAGSAPVAGSSSVRDVREAIDPDMRGGGMVTPQSIPLPPTSSNPVPPAPVAPAPGAIAGAAPAQGQGGGEVYGEWRDAGNGHRARTVTRPDGTSYQDYEKIQGSPPGPRQDPAAAAELDKAAIAAQDAAEAAAFGATVIEPGAPPANDPGIVQPRPSGGIRDGEFTGGLTNPKAPPKKPKQAKGGKASDGMAEGMRDLRGASDPSDFDSWSSGMAQLHGKAKDSRSRSIVANAMKLGKNAHPKVRQALSLALDQNTPRDQRMTAVRFLQANGIQIRNLADK